MLDASFAFEAGATLASIAVLAGYHYRLWRKTRTWPESTAMGRHRLVRDAWARSLRDGGKELIAVQTLRNWITSATFLASTAILFAMGILGAALTTDKLSAFVHKLNILGVETGTLWLLKIMLLFLMLMATFFNFSLAVRGFIHAGFAIGHRVANHADAAANWGKRDLEHGALHYTLGMRGYYLSIPLTLWLFGPLWMLAGTVLLVLLLRRID